jgi:hypothetical protein
MPGKTAIQSWGHKPTGISVNLHHGGVGPVTTTRNAAAQCALFGISAHGN